MMGHRAITTVAAAGIASDGAATPDEFRRADGARRMTGHRAIRTVEGVSVASDGAATPEDFARELEIERSQKGAPAKTMSGFLGLPRRYIERDVLTDRQRAALDLRH